jgi:hypothetical protein
VPEWREWLEALDASAPVDEELLAMLVYAVAPSVELDEHELSAARRRALLVHAAGGDLHRELTLDARAAEVLAGDLDAPGPRAELARGLEVLAAQAGGLPVVMEALSRLLGDQDLAWRVLAVALLAEELGGTD